MTNGPFREGSRRAWLWWTGDNEAAYLLSLLHESSHWIVKGLITVVSRNSGRCVVHGVARELLEQQAVAVGLPLLTIEYEGEAPTDAYEPVVQAALCGSLPGAGEFVAFGDLSSLRNRMRRSLLLAGTGLKPTFPLWGLDSQRHAEELLSSGLAAWVCAVTTDQLPPGLAGRRFDRSFLDSLPSHVDPCGDNCEFHTFVEWAPGWNRRVAVEPNRILERNGLTFADLRPLRSIAEVAALQDRADGPARAEFSPFRYYTRLERVRSYIDLHLHEELNVETVAAVAAMTPAGFRRYFRQQVGISFRTWLVKYRIARSCHLFRKSDISVGMAARSVGFRSNRTFRRVFHQLTGYSPSQYRNSYLERSRRRAN